jgi:hypothetical protein
MRSITQIVKSVTDHLQYQIELYSQIMLAIAAGWIYGIIESQWIPTNNLSGSKIFGFWYYYHVWMIALLGLCSFWLALSHITWILTNRMKYILIMCFAGLLLSALVEDISWYVTNWEPILRADWTMMKPGLGLNLGFSWIPLWYFVTSAVVVFLYWLSNKYANIGYRQYIERSKGTLS